MSSQNSSSRENLLDLLGNPNIGEQHELFYKTIRFKKFLLLDVDGFGGFG